MGDGKSEPQIFLVKGDVLRVLPFSISFKDDGEITNSPITLHTGIDMTAYWLEISFRHLIATQRAHKKLMLANDVNDSKKIARYLKEESISGMQAIVAAGIALDSYYASIKEHVNIPNVTTDAWKTNRTARYKQMAETLKIAFCLDNISFKSLRDVLKQSFQFRDKAVHPSAGMAPLNLHVELNKITDWRYATFRFYNAQNLFGLSLSVVCKTAGAKSDKVQGEISEFSYGIYQRVQPVLRKWTKQFGELL